MTKKLTGRGGPNRGQGAKAKSPGTKYIAVCVTIPPEMARRLDRYLGETGEKKSHVVARAIRAYLDSVHSAE